MKWFLVFLVLGGSAMAEDGTIGLSEGQERFAMDVRRYVFEPRPDITAYELAKALPSLLVFSTKAFDDLPPEVRRHFVEEKRP